MMFSKGLQPTTIVRLSQAVESFKKEVVNVICRQESINVIIKKMGLKGVAPKKKALCHHFATGHTKNKNQ